MTERDNQDHLNEDPEFYNDTGFDAHVWAYKFAMQWHWQWEHESQEAAQ